MQLLWGLGESAEILEGGVWPGSSIHSFPGPSPETPPSWQGKLGMQLCLESRFAELQPCRHHTHFIDE